MDIGTWQIGTATQLGLLLTMMGAVCVSRPYKTAKWHKNDPDVREREHKRMQSHRKKSRRSEFDRSAASEQEPSDFSVYAVRILGAIALCAGLALMLWSFT